MKIRWLNPMTFRSPGHMEFDALDETRVTSARSSPNIILVLNN